MILRVKKSEYSFVLFVLLFSVLFFHRYLIEIGAPDFSRYTLDMINMMMFVLAASKGIRIGRVGGILICLYVGMVIYGTFVSVVGYTQWGTDILHYIFDCRSLLRYLFFFLSCVTLVREIDVKRLFRYILGFHVINSVFIIYQYFTLDVPIYWMRGDNLNGFFGTTTGGNIYVNALLLATTIIVLFERSKGLCDKKIFIFFIALNLSISVLIELKAFFIEIVIIFFAFALPYLKHLTVKQICKGLAIIVVGTVAFWLMINQLYKLYPWMMNTLSLSKMIELAQTSSGTEIGRFTFFKDVVSIIYGGRVVSSLFGVGLGTANISGEMTLFARTYYDTHYSWYSMSYMFIEIGVIGLIVYILSFGVILCYTKKNNYFYQLTLSTVVISFFLLFYDELFRTEAGYLMFFLLSLPFIKTSSNNSTTIGEG